MHKNSFVIGLFFPKNVVGKLRFVHITGYNGPVKTVARRDCADASKNNRAPHTALAVLGGKSGFTLLELLVVVLIIGILSAAALPHYQKAVDKARYMQLLAVVKPVYQAQTAFYLANGEYTDDFSKLDIALPPGGTPVGNEIRYKDYGISIGLAPHYYISAGHYQFPASLLIYLKTGRTECRAFSSGRADALCAALGGLYSYTDSGMKVYTLK